MKTVTKPKLKMSNNAETGKLDYPRRNYIMTTALRFKNSYLSCENFRNLKDLFRQVQYHKAFYETKNGAPGLQLHVGQPRSSRTFPLGQNISQTGPQSTGGATGGLLHWQVGQPLLSKTFP